MSLSTASEIWEVLRDHIDLNERRDAAESLVTYLIENNYSVDDIQDDFSDKDITRALKGYAEQHFQEEEYEEYDEEQDDDEWN
jgi:hypothetical protein